MQLLIEMPGSGALLEVQLHLKEMYQLKSEVAEPYGKDFRTGHERCIEFRTIKEKALLL